MRYVIVLLVTVLFASPSMGQRFKPGMKVKMSSDDTFIVLNETPIRNNTREFRQFDYCQGGDLDTVSVERVSGESVYVTYNGLGGEGETCAPGTMTVMHIGLLDERYEEEFRRDDDAFLRRLNNPP